MPAAAPPARRDLARDLAASAYAHTSAVLGPGEPAMEAARVAVRRGGRSPRAVLGHARSEAIARSDGVPRIDTSLAAPDDLDELAHLLAFTRPALERAVVDLHMRHGLDHASLGHALGLSPSAAATRVAEVVETWQRELDPVLLAHLGASGCDHLTTILDPATPAHDGVDGDHAHGDEIDDVDARAAAVATDAATASPGSPRSAGVARSLDDLMAAGRVVAAHVDACAPCRDRLRAMVSVRALVAKAPIEAAPDTVYRAALDARSRPSAAPPPLDGASTARRRRWLPPVVTAGAVAAVALVAIVVAVTASDHDDGDDTRVEALTVLPEAGSALSVAPRSVDALQSPTVRLRNALDRPMGWEATPDQPWLLIEPRSGAVDAASSGTVVVAVNPDAPEGELRGMVTFTGDEGSTATVRVRTAIHRPPDVAAERDACTVRASVQDESAIDQVILHRRIGDTESSRTMQEGDVEGTWTASLPSGPSPSPMSWWISAVDALGNEARTQEQPVLPGDC